MKVLFVSAMLPWPLYSGGKVRMYNLLKQLSNKHEIHLRTFFRSEDERAYTKDLPFLASVDGVHRGRAFRPQYILKTALSSFPFLLSTYDHPDMRALIRRDHDEIGFDIVHLEPGYVYPSVELSHVPMVVAEHNIEHSIYQRYANQNKIAPLKGLMKIDVYKLKRWERIIWNRADIVTTVSNEDKAVIESVIPQIDVVTVPNGVDEKQMKVIKRSDISTKKSPVILFVGNFLWIQNQDAVSVLMKDIWPSLRKIYDTAQLRIVGRGMSKRLRSKVNQEGVHLLENVDDIRDEFEKADILMAPIRIGGGTQFKILEAMACGVPVITTALGAQGMGVVDGRDILIAETSFEYTSCVQRIMQDEKFYTLLVKNARRKIEQSYTWSTISKKLHTVWKDAYEQST